MKKYIASVQLNSSDDIAKNLKQISKWVKCAKKHGAELVLLPENCAFMGKQQSDTAAIVEPLLIQVEDIQKSERAPIQNALSQLAQQHQIYLIAGAVATQQMTAVGEKTFQTQLVYDSQGQLVAHYNKVHLYDVVLPDSEKSYQESLSFSPGDTYRLVDTPVGKVGLAICYDLRFPEQFRALANAGADLLVLPAAFTSETGKAHWKVLLRARAIENLCYVAAAAQTGRHPSGRKTYGNSLIVSPWGKIKAIQSQGEGIIITSLNLTKQQQLRQTFPVLAHQQPNITIKNA